jgi:hypothetical protein
MRNIEAIEPDFVTGSDGPEAWNEVTDKLNLRHCEDIEPHSIVPPGANPDAYMRRGIYEFNYVFEIGGPPYRFYNIQLVPDRKRKYPVLYSDTLPYTGFALLDLKKCKIKTEAYGQSEMSREYEIGRNVLVRYKGQVLALLLAYSSANYYRLDLYNNLSISGTKEYEWCPWVYYGAAKQEKD